LDQDKDMNHDKDKPSVEDNAKKQLIQLLKQLTLEMGLEWKWGKKRKN